MKLKLHEKFMGVSWARWFTELLKNNGFTRTGSGTYVNEDNTVQVRVFRPEKKYQVKIGDNLGGSLDFTFPHLTGQLHD